MKIDVQDLSPVRKALAVEADVSEVEQEREASLRRFASRARIPGFRPGKAPASLIRSRFGREIDEDVRDRLLSRLYSQATSERGLRPLGEPVLEEITFEEGPPFRFRTSFEVEPSFTVQAYRDVEVRRRAPSVSEEDIDRALEGVRERRARLVAEEGRVAQPGDVVVADVDATPEGGEPVHRERLLLEVGSVAQGPTLGDRLLGATSGSVVDAVLEEHHQDEPHEHEGEHDHTHGSIAYHVVVHEVKRREIPALDDDFARELGADDLPALRVRAREDLERHAREEAERGVRQSVVDKVLLENPIPLPEILVAEETRHRLEDLARMLAVQGVDVGAEGFDWKALYERQQEPARRAVHARLVLDAVARQEALSVDDDEVEQRIALEASRIGESAASLRRRLQKGGGLEALRNQLLREKTLDFLTSVANIRPEE